MLVLRMERSMGTMDEACIQVLKWFRNNNKKLRNYYRLRQNLRQSHPRNQKPSHARKYNHINHKIHPTTLQKYPPNRNRSQKPILSRFSPPRQTPNSSSLQAAAGAHSSHATIPLLRRQQPSQGREMLRLKLYSRRRGGSLKGSHD